MRQTNFQNELAKLKKRRRSSEVKKRLAEGPRDPWRSTRHGPLREVILTVNKTYFDDDPFYFVSNTLIDHQIMLETDDTDDTEIGINSLADYQHWLSDPIHKKSDGPRDTAFEDRAVAWLKENFGEDVVHARADRDEDAYHIHAIIVPRTTTRDGRRMLQPSKHPLIRDYEAAQDSVGNWFAEIGLRHGEKRAEAVRKAKRHNAALRTVEVPVPVPEPRRHVSPAEWRRTQEHKLAQREARTSKRESEIAQVTDVIKDVADGNMKIAKAKSTDSGKAKMARSLFGKAFARLKEQAQQEAEETLERDFAALQKARKIILTAARNLPKSARKAIEDTMGAIVQPLTQLNYGHIRRSQRERGRGIER